jgi:uncharacterized protein
MNIPTQEKIEELWDKYNLPQNVRSHSIAVANVAVFLAEKLKENGVAVDVELVNAGALLHDIDKIITLGKGNHGQLAKKMLEEEGFPEVARIAERHLIEPIVTEKMSWEEKIVSYADKIISQNKVVPFAERMEYINRTYPPDDPKLRQKGEEKFKEFEKEIFGIIDMKPEDISIK